MGRIPWTTWTALGALLIGGCATGPLQDNPIFVRPEKVSGCENPLWVPPGPAAFPVVWEKTLDIVSDYFDIAFANRFDGRVETFPKIIPGLGQIWKPGTPDYYQRTLATFQSMQYRAIVLISVADDGGYFIDVKVLKELEDLPVPSFATAGSASFRSFPTVERQYEVVDASLYDPNWIPIDRAGRQMRDYALEQLILERIAKMDLTDVKTRP
jgi:hypothetical protein